MRTWIDLTVRPEGEPEVTVNEVTGEFEYSWQLDDEQGSRITILMPRSFVDKVNIKSRELLMLLPPASALILGSLV